MLKQLSTIFLLSAIIICGRTESANAQGKLNSPYSYLGIGEVNNNGNVSTLGLSGLGAGIQNKSEINYVNPASITSLARTTYEAGLGAKFLNVTDGDSSNSSGHDALHYVSIAFPMKSIGGATCIGIRRHSNVGYGIIDYSMQDSLGLMQNISQGEGGINRLNVTQAFTFKNISIGVNLNYLFGKISHDETLNFIDSNSVPSTVYLRTAYVKDVNFDFGLQYKHTIDLDTTDRDKRIDIIVGGTFAPASKLSSDLLSFRYVVVDNNSIDTISEASDEIEIPMTFSAGFTAEWNGKLKIGFDYRSENWSSFKNPLLAGNGIYQLANSNKMIFGVQYTPTPIYKSSTKIWNRTHYRMGLSNGKSKIVNDGTQLVNYGISFGLAVSLKNFINVVGLSYEYNKLSAGGNSELIEEQYHKMTLSVTFNETWFIKRKYN